MRSTSRLSSIALIIACLAMVTACASAPSAHTQSQLNAGAVQVAIDNDAPVLATIYAMNGISKVRIGEVAANSHQLFSIRNYGQLVGFYVATQWDDHAATNEIDNVQAGDRLYVKIDSNVRSPQLFRR